MKLRIFTCVSQCLRVYPVSPQDGLVVNFYIPHNRRTPLQAEEALGPISIPRGCKILGEINTQLK